MKRLSIVYSDVESSVKGSIAQMITIKKIALSKLINKRSEKTCQKQNCHETDTRTEAR